MSFTIVTWNVNSVTARLGLIEEFIKIHNPDILLLQEIKCIDDKFPKSFFEDLGYNVAIHGQKTYNGVAILSKHIIEETHNGLQLFNEENARYIESIISINRKIFRISSIYVPNGQELNSSQYNYKLDFLDRFYNHLKKISSFDENIIIAGDWNIAPEALDVYDEKVMQNAVSCTNEERKKIVSIKNIGFFDGFRIMNPSKQQFSWWDYRGNSYNKNIGLRIDYMLFNSLCIDNLIEVRYIEEFRTKEKPSDHIPIIATIKI
jgi:exodeoxyribonuclease-3